MPTLAIDIGGTKYAMAVFEDGRLVERSTSATDRVGGRDWMMPRLIEQGLEWKKKFNFDRCGIGFGGPVDFVNQRVFQSTHVGGWSDTPLTAWVEDALGVPAIMDNDANAGALGEARDGAGQGYRSVFYMTLSTGIGGGLYLDGMIWRGADGYAGEVGHITLDPRGPECLCGSRGCFERMCCGLWLERDNGKPMAELLADAEFTAGYARNLAQGLKAVIMIVNPALVVIGGGIAKAGERLFAPLRAELEHQITSWSRASKGVAAARLGDDSVLHGAYELAKTL